MKRFCSMGTYLRYRGNVYLSLHLRYQVLLECCRELLEKTSMKGKARNLQILCSMHNVVPRLFIYNAYFDIKQSTSFHSMTMWITSHADLVSAKWINMSFTPKRASSLTRWNHRISRGYSTARCRCPIMHAPKAFVSRHHLSAQLSAPIDRDNAAD